MLAATFGHSDLHVSNGWLVRWKARHNVRCSVLSGESSDVPADAVADWARRLPVVCEGYAPRHFHFTILIKFATYRSKKSVVINR